MSWDAARQHEKQYREKRWAALNNERKQEWFTTPLGELTELFDEKYDRDTENEKWQQEYDKKKTKNADFKKLMGWRIRLASLCSRTRDLRCQFAAWDDNRVRTPLDWDRFEYGRLGYNEMKLDNLDQVVKDLDKGVKTLPAG